MPENILDKIKYLCRAIPKVEWSGVLFYTIEGSIKNPATMVITLKDILPMDKGSKAYTEYDLDERFETYLMEKPVRMSYNVGHIHSHNDMNVYFSGTDMSELNDNTEAHNFYLSLIVNNFMDFKAKVAYRATAEKLAFPVPYKALDENGEEYVVTHKNFFVKSTVMYEIDCMIDSPRIKIKIPKSFASQVDLLLRKEEIEAEKRKEEAEKKRIQESFDKMKQDVKQLPPPITGRGFKDAAKNFVDSYTKGSYDKRSDLELFTMSLLNFSNTVGDDDSIEELLTELVEYEMTTVEISKCILELYTPLYSQFFPDRTGNDFKNDTEEVIEMLEEQEMIFPIITQTVDALKSMSQKFNEYAI